MVLRRGVGNGEEFGGVLSLCGDKEEREAVAAAVEGCKKSKS